MKKRKWLLLPVLAMFFGILISVPTKAGIWERHYWKGFLYIVDEYLAEGEKPDDTDIHNYYGKEEKLTIPQKVNGIPVDSVISMGKKPGIKEVHISNGVYIYGRVLSQIPTLKTITVDQDNPDYMVKNGLLLSKDGKTLIACPGGLKSVEIPDSVIKIDFDAFQGASIKEITLGKNISVIEGGAFSDCKNLKKVHFQEGICVEELSGTFSDCQSLETITLPEGVKKLDVTFADCTSLKSVILPDSLEVCGAYVFGGCKNLEKVVFGKNIKQIQEFVKTPKLQEVYIYSKDCQVTIEDMLGQEFYMINERSKCMDQVIVYGVAGSETISMAEKYGISYELIGKQEPGKERYRDWEYVLSTEGEKTYATITNFYGREKQMKLPSSIGDIPVIALKSLGENPYVETISIPDGIKVQGKALASCKKLKTIRLSGKNDSYQVVNKMLLSKDGKTLVACPGNLKYPKIPATVKKVADGAFSGSMVRKVTISKNITDLGMGTFWNCQKLSAVTFSKDSRLKVLKHNVFRNCTALKKAELPDSIEELWNFVFFDCSSLKTASIGENLKFSGTNNFQNCKKLTALYLYAEDVSTKDTRCLVTRNLLSEMPKRKNGFLKATVHVKKGSQVEAQIKEDTYYYRAKVRILE